ncbi:MAG: nucleotidyltransferase family protein, partial [Muribaculaceae bacterium]|nr:nucleotidyltransferase family protein [Muribaculaceae bacterium]
MVFRDAGFINTFFLLLRSGMYGIPVPESELPESIDWKAVLALAQQHAVVGTIINSVQFLPDSLRPSASTSAKMNKFALGLIQTNMVLDRTAARLVAFLEQRGIRGVLLKGQGVARYYPMPQIRQTGDIDFYVGREQYRRAVEVCREQLASNKAECEEMEVHFSFDMGGVEIELHRL